MSYQACSDVTGKGNTWKLIELCRYNLCRYAYSPLLMISEYKMFDEEKKIELNWFSWKQVSHAGLGPLQGLSIKKMLYMNDLLKGKGLYLKFSNNALGILPHH